MCSLTRNNDKLLICYIISYLCSLAFSTVQLHWTHLKFPISPIYLIPRFFHQLQSHSFTKIKAEFSTLLFLRDNVLNLLEYCLIYKVTMITLSPSSSDDDLMPKIQLSC